MAPPHLAGLSGGLSELDDMTVWIGVPSGTAPRLGLRSVQHLRAGIDCPTMREVEIGDTKRNLGPALLVDRIFVS